MEQGLAAVIGDLGRPLVPFHLVEWGDAGCGKMGFETQPFLAGSGLLGAGFVGVGSGCGGVPGAEELGIGVLIKKSALNTICSA